jgi:predicted acylesterase/phospholipase RssA
MADTSPGTRPRAHPRLAACGLALAAALTAAGCASPQPRSGLPAELAPDARPAALAAVRYWADEAPRGFQQWLGMPEDELRARYGEIMDRPHAYLLLSGGGDDGAFGAGLLTGWTEHGTRPEFQIVTGISTGALIAPFAFLGSAHDAKLREIYTSFSSRDLVRRRGVFEALTGDSAFDTSPLRSLVERYVGDAEIAAIAREARRGRSLLIGTTNLDAARPVVWDVTRIAAAGGPRAKRLIHDVMIASAAIPGAFPPVLIEVEADGRRFDEMHVDGGVTSQLFLGAEGLDWQRIATRLRVQGQPQIYIVRNARLRDPWTEVQPRLVPIVARTISSLIRAQGIGDLARIYIAAERGGLGFNLARVPPDFDVEPTELFDRTYMAALFERGRAMAQGGYPWIRGPADAAERPTSADGDERNRTEPSVTP